MFIVSQLYYLFRYFVLIYLAVLFGHLVALIGGTGYMKGIDDR